MAVSKQELWYNQFMNNPLTRFSLLALLLTSCAQAPNQFPSPSASPTQAQTSPANSPAPVNPAAKGPTQITMSKASYVTGEKISFSFTADPLSVQDKTAWIGLIAADVPHGSATENDKYDLAYIYLEGRNSGELSFDAPPEPGNYTIRLHNSESGLELASADFTVTGAPKPLTGNALALDKSRYAPGETINITVSIKAEDKKDDTAWLGIVPAAVDHGSEATNDRYNLGYKFLDKLLFGKTTLPAPKAPGLYDIRLHDTDTDGRELAFISFVVE